MRGPLAGELLENKQMLSIFYGDSVSAIVAVTSAATGQPVAGAFVQIFDLDNGGAIYPGASGYTDARGVFNPTFNNSNDYSGYPDDYSGPDTGTLGGYYISQISEHYGIRVTASGFITQQHSAGVADLYSSPIRIAAPPGVFDMVLAQNPDYAVPFMDQLFENELGRASTSAEIAPWADLLRTNTPTSIAADVIRSQEKWTDVVTTAYRQFLGRDPELEGLSAWVNQLETGFGIQKMTETILASSEYFNKNGSTVDGFIQGLYGDLLRRPADSAGMAFWVIRLNDGASRADIAHGFIHSPEYNGQAVDVIFREYLHRSADPGSLNVAVAALVSGSVSIEQYTAFVAGSPEAIGDL